jgi:uridylate kinase
MSRPRFNRILLKLSGEVLMGTGQFGIDPDMVARVAGVTFGRLFRSGLRRRRAP